MKFQREKTHEIFEEIKPLLARHYHEIAHYKDIKLEPSWDEYRFLEEREFLRTFTARDDRNELIGYAVFFVKPNLHYRGSLQAVQDIIYIDSERRGFGKEFIKWCDSQLKSEGVQAVYHHVKKSHNWGPMLERMGYQLIDLVYGKRLDQWE